MPATRRSRASSGPVARGGQTTLSFGHQAKITKSSVDTAKAVKDVELAKPDIAAIESVSDIGATAPTAVDEEELVTVAPPPRKTKLEQRAETVTDAELKRYWQRQEAERKTPRVHQGDLTVEEKILRQFDVSSQYGPCIGMTRRKRWMRARKLGLKPPMEVLAVLLREDREGQSASERAHIDELMSLTATVGEA